jgi:hypothetical protein
MSRKYRLVPWVAAAGAVLDKLLLVQKRGGQLTIWATVKVDHVLAALTGVAMYKETRTVRASLLALLGIV